MQAKVQIMYTCPDCQGEGGYIEWGDYPDPEALVRYEGCPTCRGKVNRTDENPAQLVLQGWADTCDVSDNFNFYRFC